MSTNNTTEKNKGGRPSRYKPEYVELANKLCLLGLVDEELGKFFSVDESTIHRWRARYKDFAAACKQGKTIADAEVAERFYNRVKGYDYLKETFEKVDNKLSLQMMESNTMLSDPYRKKVETMHLPADPGAALNWLKNRQPKLWRDKQDIALDLNNLTDEQIDALLLRAQNLATQ